MGVLQSHLPSPQIRIMVKKQIWGLLRHKPGSRPHHRQGSDSHRAKGKLPSISRGGWGHNNSNQSPDQGVKGPSLWTNLTRQGEDNRARGARIRQPAEQTTNPENVTK